MGLFSKKPKTYSLKVIPKTKTELANFEKYKENPTDLFVGVGPTSYGNLQMELMATKGRGGYNLGKLPKSFVDGIMDKYVSGNGIACDFEVKSCKLYSDGMEIEVAVIPE